MGEFVSECANHSVKRCVLLHAWPFTIYQYYQRQLYMAIHIDQCDSIDSVIHHNVSVEKCISTILYS